MYLCTEHHMPRMPKHAMQLVYSAIQTFQKGKRCNIAGEQGEQDTYFNSE